MSEGEFDSLRQIPELRACLGCRLIDLTTTDRDEVLRGEPDQVHLHFDNGTTVSLPITDDGIDISPIDGEDEET